MACQLPSDRFKIKNFTNGQFDIEHLRKSFMKY